MGNSLHVHDGEWNLHTVTSAKAIVTLQDRENKLKGMSFTIINTGGGAVRDRIPDRPSRPAQAGLRNR